MADNRPIGVFDSGLGGLTVVKEILNVLPNEDIIYFGDTDRVPYGTKSRDTIRRYARQDEAFLLSQNVKLIVAACGTVSSVASDIGEQLPVPYVEVVSHAAKAAVKATKNGKIGVIGTSATVMSGEHKRVIENLLPSAKVYVQSCTLFVPLVESGFTDEKDVIVYETVKRYLEPLKEAGVDTLILGCTHYPVLSNAIKKISGENIVLINMGEATALPLKEQLTKSDSLNITGEKGKVSFYVSDKAESFRKTASILLGEDIDENTVEQVDISIYDEECTN